MIKKRRHVRSCWEWNRELPGVCRVHNSTHHSTIGTYPYAAWMRLSSDAIIPPQSLPTVEARDGEEADAEHTALARLHANSIFTFEQQEC